LRLAELRRAANLSQAALARLIGESQQNVAFREQSDKPPRSDVLPKLARVLGVSVEQILDVKTSIERRNGPVGKVRKLFEEVSELPRRQQEKVAEFVSALVEQYKRRAS
jgi:transcriptional regulator with XRE-family HTH domain